MIKFSKGEIPVTHSLMYEERKKRSRVERLHPFISYLYYWAGFNEIYSTISFMEGYARKYDINPTTNQIVRKPNGNVMIPKVPHIQEYKQIEYAIEKFDDELKRNLIMHPSTEFFHDRIASWEGCRIEFDADHQRVNGVIKTSQTIDKQYPVWSPIDTVAYPDYLANRDSAARDLLTKQIVDLLYAVRCNLVHGDKPGDNNDIEVVEHALPLLKTIVSAFIYRV